MSDFNRNGRKFTLKNSRRTKRYGAFISILIDITVIKIKSSKYGIKFYKPLICWLLIFFIMHS